MPNGHSATVEGHAVHDGYENPAYRWYVVVMLLVVHVFGHVDRQVMNVLVEPIKHEFGLSDTVMGLMTGAAFALFYAVLALPLALWADRRKRRNLIAVAITLWSAMTVLCGMAATAFQLILARIGVAVGEAGSNPASHSMVSDIFPPARRATPMAVMAMGPNLGILLGFTAGGLLSAAYDWRMAFIVVGLPGILVGLVVLLTIREPTRGHADGATGAAAIGAREGVREVFAAIRARRSLLFIIAGFSFSAFFGYGSIAWLTAFFERSYGLSRGHIGPMIGLVVGIAGSMGTFSGGVLADRLGKRDVRWRLWIISIVALAAAPFGLAAFLVYDWTATLLLIAVPATVSVFHAGPSFALLQGLVDVRIRALAAGFLLFTLNVFGGALGPFYVGVISDLLEPRYGVESLRYALMSLTWAGVASALCYFLASRSLKRDLDHSGQPVI